MIMSQTDVLRTNSVFLVHCITQNGGAGNVFVQGKTLYERFEICYRDKPELSCSTIQKGDTIQYLRRNNFFGPCGLIIIPGIISFATHQDSGTHVEEYGLRLTEFGLTTIASEFEVENAIKKRNVNSYNELTVKDYSIFGIFLNIDDSAFLYHNIIYERTKKYDKIYLERPESGNELQAVCKQFIHYYNERRDRSSIGDVPPNSKRPVNYIEALFSICVMFF